MYQTIIKRSFDVSVASILLLLSVPLLIVTAILVRIFLGSPILFIQQRPGWYEKPFYLYKFRTMRDVKNQAGELLSDAERLTKFGKLIRSLSLDELPALINVIKGDMSLVGPRPLLMEYLAHYTPEQRLRHHLRPGITGYAQINGRNALAWEERFKLDVWYVQHCSFALDMKILLWTVIRVCQRNGIHAVGEATMKRFDR